MRATDHTHSPTPEDIMEYVDGEGSAASRDHIAAHLATCADCQEIAAEQRGISEHARAWTVPPAPDSLRPSEKSTQSRVARVLAFRPPARWILAGLSTAAAVLLIVPFTTRQRPLPVGAVARTTAPDSTELSPSKVAGRAAIAGNLKSRAAGEAGQPLDRLQVLGQTSNVPQTVRMPSIIRTARLQIVVKDFGTTRASVEALVTQAGGFIDHMTVTGDTSEARVLRGTLRVPGDRMADTLARLRGMGQVTEDTQGSQDVSDELVDLDARLASARATEQRLTELLRNRTGRLSDVLEVERELTRVRLDIERLDAQKANLGRRVSYATIDLTVSEERKVSLDGPLSLATRIRVAAADGLEALIETATAMLLFALRAGPTLLFWGGIVALGWLGLRRRIRFGMQDPR